MEEKIKMDIQILRAIVQSCSEVTKEVDDPEEFKKCLMEEKFPPMNPAILAALARSFANLISHKVSPKAYQRHSVRIQVIEVLRDWLRPTNELESFRAFSHGERFLDFTTRILRIYLKKEIPFEDDGNMDVLLKLAKALLCLLPMNRTFVPDLEKLLVRIALLKQTENSQRLVLSIIREKNRLGIGFEIVEKLYISQSVKLIEEPLIENFIENLQDNKNIDDPGGLKNSCETEELLKIAASSPTIFQIASSVLKEIFFRTNYSPKVMNYIKFFLNSLNYRCQESDKNVLDLYPLSLQSCALLLNIEPEQHTSKTRDYVLNSLDKINSTKPEETLILLSHYPSWLEAMAARIEVSRVVTNI